MKITMDYQAYFNLHTVAADAAKTLTGIMKATGGRLKQDLAFQLTELNSRLQEAVDAAQVTATPGKPLPVYAIVGHVHCIDVSQNDSKALRYYGTSGPTPVTDGPSWGAHEFQREAEADVRNWFAGKPVEYPKHAETVLVPRGTTWESAERQLQERGIARLAPAAAAGAHASPTIGAVLAQPGGEQLVAELLEKRNRTQAQIEAVLNGGFIIGPGNTWPQAWAATLAGHQIRLPAFPPGMSWVFERNHQELLSVYGDTHDDWKRSGTIVCPTGQHQLSEKWEVLAIIDRESPTV